MIYFKNSPSLDTFKTFSNNIPSSLDAICKGEEVLISNDVEENCKKCDLKEPLSLKTILVNIAMVVTVIPFLVKIFIDSRKQKAHEQLVNELEQIKWRGFFAANSIDRLIAIASDPDELKKKAVLFVNELKDLEAPIKDNIITDLEKGNLKAGFKKLKEHYQITSFYKAYAHSVKPIASDSKVQTIFEIAKNYMEGSLRNKQDSRFLYLSITTVRSGLLLNSWLEALCSRGEITSDQCKALISKVESCDNRGFIDSLKDTIKEKIATTKAKGPNIGHFFYKEIWDTLVRIDPDQSIHEFGKHLAPLFYYQNLYSKLDEVESEIVSMQKHEITKERLESISNIIKASEIEVMTSIAADIIAPPVFDYQFRALAGLLKRKFSHINDELKNSGALESHDSCGCHHSYSNSKEILFSKQVVDINKSRINLEKKLSKVEGKLKIGHKIEKLTIKQEILKADIVALKLSEKGRENKKTSSKKPIILGLTCSFGSGHKTPAAAVAKFIGSNNAHFSVADAPDDILKPACLFNKLGNFFGRDWKKSDAYSYIIKKQWHWIPRLFLKITKFIKTCVEFFSGSKKKTHVPEESYEKELIRKRLLMEMPDHLMTFYHMDLLPILEVAEEMGIPTTHYATDFSAKMDEPFGKIAPAHPMFKLVTASNSKATIDSAFPIKNEDIITSSGAIRPLFLTKTNESTLNRMRQERGIDKDTSTILFMGGGFGQPIDFPEQLAANMDVQNKLHLIVIAGGNKEFGDHFEELTKQGTLRKEGNFYKGKNPNVTIEIAKDPATKTKNTPYYIGESAINRYFDLADVLYTPPGGSTTLEALTKELTILFDSRSPLMPWEEDNMEQAIALGNLKNTSNSTFVDDLMQAIASSKTVVKQSRNLPPISDVINQRLRDVHAVEPNSWQKDKFLHYRFDLPLKKWEDHCIIT